MNNIKIALQSGDGLTNGWTDTTALSLLQLKNKFGTFCLKLSILNL